MCMNPNNPMDPTHPPANHETSARSHVQSFVLLVLTAAGIALCYTVAAPFVPAMAWSLALAVLFTPAQQWLEVRLKSHNAAALVSTLLIALMVVVPASFVGQRLVVQAAKSAELVETKVNSGEWRRAIARQPRLAPIADEIEREFDLPGTAKSLTSWLSTTAGAIVTGSVFQVISFVLIFYLLFFFLRDRKQALQAIRSISPLSDTEMTRLYRRVSDTIHATVYGTLAVSTVQGVLGGLMFWWLGLPGALLWGVVMALLAVVPVLGAFVVWIPAALFLAMEGSWGKALVLTLWGILVVGTIDNLLRPVLVGNRLKLHTVLAFISVVGGLMWFGPSGLILGPVVLTITCVLLEIWHAAPTADDQLCIESAALSRYENEGGMVVSESDVAA